MCFGGDQQADPGAKKNEEIEKSIRADKKKASREVKILLLGRYPTLVARNLLLNSPSPFRSR